MRTCTKPQERTTNGDECTAFMHWYAHAQVRKLPLQRFWAGAYINRSLLDAYQSIGLIYCGRHTCGKYTTSHYVTRSARVDCCHAASAAAFLPSNWSKSQLA